MTKKEIIIIILIGLIQTNWEIYTNRADIIVKLYVENKGSLIDFADPSEKNTSLKTIENLNKYKDFKREISGMFHLMTKILRFVIRVLAMISKGANKFVEQVTGCPKIYEL